jgi:hypothetical protein
MPVVCLGKILEQAQAQQRLETLIAQKNAQIAMAVTKARAGAGSRSCLAQRSEEQEVDSFGPKEKGHRRSISFAPEVFEKKATLKKSSSLPEGIQMQQPVAVRFLQPEMRLVELLEHSEEGDVA